MNTLTEGAYGVDNQLGPARRGALLGGLATSTVFAEVFHRTAYDLCHPSNDDGRGISSVCAKSSAQATKTPHVNHSFGDAAYLVASSHHFVEGV